MGGSRTLRFDYQETNDHLLLLQEEREAREMVKREQDEAYQASLRQDRAKVRFQLCSDNFLLIINRKPM